MYAVVTFTLHYLYTSLKCDCKKFTPFSYLPRMDISHYNVSLLPPMPKDIESKRALAKTKKTSSVPINVIISNYTQKALQISVLQELQQRNLNNDVDKIFEQRKMLHDKLLASTTENHAFVKMSISENVNDKNTQKKGWVSKSIINNVDEIKFL